MLIEWVLQEMVPVAGTHFLVEIDRANIWKDIRNHDFVNKLKHILDCILPNQFELFVGTQHHRVFEVQLGDEMPQSFQEHNFEITIDGRTAQIAQNFIEKIYHFCCFLVLVGLLLLDLEFVRLVLVQQSLINIQWLNVQKSSMEYLFSQIVDFVLFLHFVIIDQCLIYEGKAIVKGHRRQLGNLTKYLGPLILNLVLMNVEYCLCID